MILTIDEEALEGWDTFSQLVDESDSVVRLTATTTRDIVRGTRDSEHLFHSHCICYAARSDSHDALLILTVQGTLIEIDSTGTVWHSAVPLRTPPLSAAHPSIPPFTGVRLKACPYVN